MFDRLIALSQDKSSDSRRELLKSISELFTDGAETYSDAEAQLFSDIFCRLVDQVSLDVRAEMSRQMAPEARTPHAVALRLASDEALSVSGVMLEKSSVLTDTDLRDIAGSQSQAHLLAITRRQNLSETVTEVLAARGDEAVLEGVSSNATARFSDLGLQRLATRGLDFPQVLVTLSQRADMPPERLSRVISSLDAEGRAKLQTLAAASPDFAAMLLTEATETAQRQKEALEREVASLLRRAKQGLGSLDECIARFVRDDRFEAVAELLVQASGLEDAHIANVLRHTNDFGLAVVCRSLGVGDKAYLKLSQMRANHLGRPLDDAQRWAGNYTELDRESADRALRFHRVRVAVMKDEGKS